MVCFTCNHCGESLQKPKVAKHYQFRCHKVPFLTCVDCLKDFREEEYVTHTKCISEAERYGGKNFVAKANANKGERKQQQWICAVNSLLNGEINLSNAEIKFLQILSKYENIPRKKSKFLNFVKNAVGSRVNMTVVETIWNKMENAHKKNLEATIQFEEPGSKQVNKTGSNEKLNNSLSTDHHANVDNQNNENLCKEHDTAQHQNVNNESCEINGDLDKMETVKKKSKKRKLVELAETQEKQLTKKSKKTSILLETNAGENEEHKVMFDWRSTIIGIVQNKNEISLKKLQKKVVSLYMSHSTKNVEREKVVMKFQKKLKKVPEIVISDNMVKLMIKLEVYADSQSEKTVR